MFLQRCDPSPEESYKTYRIYKYIYAIVSTMKATNPPPQKKAALRHPGKKITNKENNNLRFLEEGSALDSLSPQRIDKMAFRTSASRILRTIKIGYQSLKSKTLDRMLI
jgi:hypothetical protein